MPVDGKQIFGGFPPPSWKGLGGNVILQWSLIKSIFQLTWLWVLPQYLFPKCTDKMTISPLSFPLTFSTTGIGFPRIAIWVFKLFKNSFLEKSLYY